MNSIKKCPKCNSTRLGSLRGKTECRKCGYIHIVRVLKEKEGFYTFE